MLIIHPGWMMLYNGLKEVPLQTSLSAGDQLTVLGDLKGLSTVELWLEGW